MRCKVRSDRFLTFDEDLIVQRTDLPAPYSLKRPDIVLTDLKYVHAKQEVPVDSVGAQAGCHESLSWVKGLGVEVISQGVKHGAPVKHGQPQKSKAM